MPVLLTIKILIMKKKRIIIAAITILILGGGWYGYKEYTRMLPDLSRVKADMRMSGQELIAAFEKNETAANQAYLDKIVAVQGTVKAIEKDEKGFYTISIGEEGSLSSVRCSMNVEHQDEIAQLAKGSIATIKGAVTGFNADELLGADVILNRCVIEKN